MQLDITKLETFDRVTEKKYKSPTATLSLDPDGSRIRLNTAAVELLSLKTVNKDLRIKFFRFDKNWYLAMTLQCDGYNVALETKARAGATVGATVVLHQMLRNNHRIKNYYLSETEHELAGHKLYELLPKPNEKQNVITP